MTEEHVNAPPRLRRGPDTGWLGRLHSVRAEAFGRLRAWPSTARRDAAQNLQVRGERRVRRRARDAGPQPLQTVLLEAYKTWSYRTLGARLDSRTDRHLGERLRQSGYNVSAGLYKALQVHTTLLAAVLAFALVTGLLVALRLPLVLPWALGVAGAGAVATFVAFPMAVSNRVQNRRRALERDLPFSLSELSVLASIGLAPIELFRRMANREHDPAMTDTFRNVVHRVDIQGKDLITALAETAKDSPSEALRETLWDLGNMIHQGGDLGTYLQQRSSEVLERKRAQQTTFIDQLTTYADAYVTVVLMGVIFIAIGAFLMDAFGRSAGSLSADALLMLLTYGIMPFIVLMVGILLASAYSANE